MKNKNGYLCSNLGFKKPFIHRSIGSGFLNPCLWIGVILVSSLCIVSCAREKYKETAPSYGCNSNCGCTNPISICGCTNDLSNIPASYKTAITKYTNANTNYSLHVCTQDSDSDGSPDYMVVESSNRPEHKSHYFETTHALYELFDFLTNLYKYAATKTSAGYSGAPGPAGHNKIAEQFIVMKMPISPDNASSKTNTTYSTIGLALNGVSFFNENAAPGDQITNELFTFDQCSGHPQNSGVYHYHVDPVCLIRDLGGSVTDNSTTVNGTTYRWIEDSGSNGNLLLGFLLDGHPVYGPVGDNHTDSNGNATPSIDSYNGHFHATTEFSSGTYHYHVKTANIGGTSSSVFWITNEKYFGTPGSVRIY